ncbi:MAG: KTSC domain-containing protein [Blastochloris sp.]|nr:KTSC domain-containing protein [Blastochloris sp.]
MSDSNILDRVALRRVQSKNLRQVGYDPKDRILVVQFQTGAWWIYRGLEPDAYQDMLKAQSVGSYFSTRIKNFYDAQKLEVEPGREPKLDPEVRVGLVVEPDEADALEGALRLMSRKLEAFDSSMDDDSDPEV